VANILINDLGDVVECPLSKSACDAKQEGVAGMPAGPAALQRDPGRPEEWSDRNLMQFNKKRQVLPLGRNNPIQEYTLGLVQLESSSAEKDLGILVDMELSVSQR